MKFLPLLLLVFAFGCSSSKKSVGKAGNENALLWEISGNGLQQPSYLYGTIHMICPEDFVMSETVKQKFSSAADLYLEIDMDDPSMTMKTLQLSMMKDQSLKDLMNAESYAKLERFMQDSVGMPLSLFNKMKPFTLMSLLYTKMLPCKGIASYEQRFMEMAKQEKKDVHGLEKLEDQFAIFDQIPDSTEARMIIEMISRFQEQRQEFSKMTAAYKSKDLNTLYRMISASPDMAGFEDILLNNRNRYWIPVMEKAMTQEPVFFAVGAGHLPGENGVISLLRNAGYQVKAIE